MTKIKLLFLKFKASCVLLHASFLGYSFRLGSTDEDLKMANKLRYSVYAASKYIDPAAHPLGELTDKYSVFSNDVLAFYKSNLVGTLRMTHDSEYGFPTENLFNIKRLVNRRSVVEIGRLVIDPKLRQKNIGNRLVMFGLVYRAFMYSLENNIHEWIVNMPDKLAHSFEQFGAYPERIPEKEPTVSNINARSLISGYFELHVLSPYRVDLLRLIHSVKIKTKK